MFPIITFLNQEIPFGKQNKIVFLQKVFCQELYIKKNIYIYNINTPSPKIHVIVQKTDTFTLNELHMKSKQTLLFLFSFILCLSGLTLSLQISYSKLGDTDKVEINVHVP